MYVHVCIHILYSLHIATLPSIQNHTPSSPFGRVSDTLLPSFTYMYLYYCYSFSFPSSVHVVFGHVVKGMEYVTAIENQKVDVNHRPYADVRIQHCGELVLRT